MDWKRILILVIAPFCIGDISMAGDPVYPVSDISREMLANAKAVIRDREIVFEVKSFSGAVQEVRTVITILNENGADLSYLLIPYDRYSSVHKIRGAVYDASGKVIRKLNESNIIDHSFITGSTVFDDNRVKFYDPEYRVYPFTVEYSYEISYSGLNDYPDWDVLPDYNVSAEITTFTARMAAGTTLRYSESALPCPVVKGETDGQATYSCQALLVPAMVQESFSRPFEEICPILYLAPSEFEMDHFPGNASTWKDFGKWIYDLNRDRNDLDASARARFVGLVKGIDDPIEKVRVLYEHMQQRTRYVSIQVGIGSWQPFLASVVDEKGYGDCKALVFYMKCILESVGIPSIYTLVRAGGEAPRLITSFPSNQFNHVILCVPFPGDTIWLECTSPHIPFGYLGTFTDDRDVLLITEEGGLLSHTPYLSEQENRSLRKAVVDILPEGDAAAHVVSGYTGLYFDKMFPLVLAEDYDRKKMASSMISIPSFNIQACTYSEKSGAMPMVEEGLLLALPNYYSHVGEKAIIRLNLMKEPGQVINSILQRKGEIDIRRPYTSIDSVIFILPDELSVDKLPPAAEFESPFGRYRATVSAEANRVIYQRTLVMQKGIFPASQLPAFKEFLEKVEKQDGMKCSLMRSE